MKCLQVVSWVALAGQLAIHVAAAERDTATLKAPPPVLRASEPSDNVVLKLPGAPAPPPRATAPAPVPGPLQPPAQAPVQKTVLASVPAIGEKPPLRSAASIPPPKTESAPAKPVEIALRREPPKSPFEAESRTPILKPKPALPPAFMKDSALFCQAQIGQWKQADARSLMGSPLRQRPAFGDDQKVANGRIYAFSDPSGRYRELELDFDKSTGTLRTVFGYPPKLTWKDCQRLWGNKVAAADAKQGRTFYSYLNRRLDVLVDQNGNVISLGLY